MLKRKFESTHVSLKSTLKCSEDRGCGLVGRAVACGTIGTAVRIQPMTKLITEPVPTYILLKRRNQRKRCRAGPIFKTNIKDMKIVSKQTSAGKDEMRNPRMCFASKC